MKNASAGRKNLAMPSIRVPFKQVLQRRGLSQAEFLRQLAQKYPDDKMGYWYLNYLLNHPHIFRVHQINAFTHLLGLSPTEQRALFLRPSLQMTESNQK